MNQTDRKRLYRLKRLIGEVPPPAMGFGSQSATVVGYANYAADMKELIPAIQNVLNDLCLMEMKGIEEWDYIHPDKSMDAIEKWINKRKKADWTLPVPIIEIEK